KYRSFAASAAAGDSERRTLFDAVLGSFVAPASETFSDEEDNVAHLRVPLGDAEEEEAPAAAALGKRAGRYGAFAGLYDDDDTPVFEQYRRATEAVAAPVAAHRAEVSAMSTDAGTPSAVYRRSLLVRGTYAHHDHDSFHSEEEEEEPVVIAEESKDAAFFTPKKVAPKQDDDDDNDDDDAAAFKTPT
ncbi:MAG: hypothetical protein AAFU70_14775, partial [Planctomycetota bacterium]